MYYSSSLGRNIGSNICDTSNCVLNMELPTPGGMQNFSTLFYHILISHHHPNKA